MSSLLLKPCREYSSFKFDSANRDMGYEHADKIAESMDNLYMLDLYPIVTNSERVIDDGQHRFYGAKEMKIPFYFISGDDISIEDVANANRNTKPYTIKDALHVYSAVGIEPYVYLRDYLGERAGSQNKIGWMRSLLEGSGSASAFIDGFYSIRRPEYAGVVESRVNDFAALPRKEWVWSSAYRDALANLTLNPLYDHKRMMDRLSRVSSRLVPCGTVAEAMGILDNIYNYNLDKKNIVQLRMLGPNGLVNRYDKDFAPIERTQPPPQRSVAHDKIVEVHKADCLDGFIVHPSARPVENAHLKAMIESMRQKSLLKYYPIIVDRDYVVYDGQRRLLAARELGLPVHYIMASNISMLMVAQAGSRSKGWAYADYLKHFCVMNKEPYLYLADYIKKFPYIGLTRAIIVLWGQGTYDDNQSSYRAGDFSVRNPGMGVKFAKCIGGLEKNEFRKNGVFQRSFLMQMHNEKFDPDYMIDAINQRPEMMRPFADMESCFKCMENTYNYGKKNRLSFRKLTADEMFNRWG